MKSGRILIVVLFVVGLIGTLVSYGPVYPPLLYTALFLTAISWMWTRLSLQQIGLSRKARSLRGSVGDIFEEHFEVTNSGRLMVLWLEVFNQTSLPGASGSKVLTSLGGRQKRSYVARTWLTRRGGFSLGPTLLTSGDPFGLFRTHKVIPATDSLVVLPMIYELEAFLSPPGLLPGGKAIRRRALDLTPHAAGVREYVPGDPLKRIHWPTSVRHNQLMVKEFEQDPQAEVWLFLDAQGRVHSEKEPETTSPASVADANWLFGRKPTFVLPPSSFEYAVSIAASLAHYFIQQRRSVGFIAAGQVRTVLPAERSLRQESKILETLAFLEPKGDLPLASVISTQSKQLPQGSSAILITPSVRSDFLLAVEDLQRRNLRPIVILLISESFGGYKGGEELAASLFEHGIPTCKIYCGTDLAQVLTAFSSQFSTQEIRSTWLPQSFTL